VRAPGDAIPAGHEVIEVQVAELKQLFSPVEHFPFTECGLDSRAADRIADLARNAPRGVPLALLIHVDRGFEQPDDATTLRLAVHDCFATRAERSRRRREEVLRRGRISLVIALAFLGVLTALGTLLAARFGDGHVGRLASESLAIGGWVAMWHPLELCLYEWWPITADARLSDRLATMPVSISHARRGRL